jgi:signal transduction histidine kinase
MSPVTFVAANMCASIGAVLYEARSRKNAIRVQGTNTWVRDILLRNGFLCPYIGTPPIAVRRGTVIEYQEFLPSHDSRFAGYVEEQLAGKRIPSMTDMVRKKFRQSIHEIFENAVVHSYTERVFACGQLFPKKDRLEFSIADIGIGMRERIRRKHNQELAPEQAICWAMSGTNTTKTGSVPGGNGLKLLREFIELNGGKIHIASDRGYWEFSEGKVSVCAMEYPFPGTVVNIEINTADAKSYRLASETPFEGVS